MSGFIHKIREPEKGQLDPLAPGIHMSGGVDENGRRVRVSYEVREDGTARLISAQYIEPPPPTEPMKE